MGDSIKAAYEAEEAERWARQHAELAARVASLSANDNRGFEALREAIDGLRVLLPTMRLDQKEWNTLHRVLDAWDLKERRLTRS